MIEFWLFHLFNTTEKSSSVTCSSKKVQQNGISVKCLDTITEINIYWFVATQWDNWFQGRGTTQNLLVNDSPALFLNLRSLTLLKETYTPSLINLNDDNKSTLPVFCCFCVRFYLTMTHFLFALLLFDFRYTTIVHNGFGIQLNDGSYNCSFTFYGDRTELSTVWVINFILHKADLQLRRYLPLNCTTRSPLTKYLCKTNCEKLSKCYYH